MEGVARTVGGSVDTGDKIKVGVVDDHDLMVAGVRALLSTQNSPARFIAAADSVDGLLRTQHDLDVVVLAVRLGDGSHPRTTSTPLKGRGLPVLLHADRTHREAAPILVRAGAHGLVWKNDPAIHLLRAIVAVSQGEHWMPVGGPHAVSLPSGRPRCCASTPPA